MMMLMLHFTWLITYVGHKSNPMLLLRNSLHTHVLPLQSAVRIQAVFRGVMARVMAGQYKVCVFVIDKVFG